MGGFDTVISAETFRNQIPLVDLSSASSLTNISQVTKKSKNARTDKTAKKEADGHKHAGNKQPWLSYKVGDVVSHKSFGMGIIESLDERYIMISFDSSTKKFLFPQCFEKGYFNI